MIVKVHKKGEKSPEILRIQTEFIKLESAMKLANCIESGGMAKNVIQDGLVEVNGEVCLMRGKKLRPGDSFAFQGQQYLISGHGA